MGDLSANYERLTIASDGTSTTEPAATLTTWSFASSSLSITIYWSADASNVVSISANMGSDLVM